MSPQSPSLIQTTLAPWLSVRGSVRALEFYKSAFGAAEVHRMDAGGGVVARLSIDGAEFWLGDESPEHGNFSPETTGGSTTRRWCTSLRRRPRSGSVSAADSSASCTWRSSESGWSASSTCR